MGPVQHHGQCPLPRRFPKRHDGWQASASGRGTADGNVPVQQSQKFAAALTKTLGAGNVTLKLLDGAGHADAAFTTPANVKLVLDWLDAQLK